MVTPNSTRKLCCKMKQDVSRYSLCPSHDSWKIQSSLACHTGIGCLTSVFLHSPGQNVDCQLFSTSARNTTKATHHIRCFQVGILGCTFSELQFIRMAVGRAATGAEGHNNRLHQQQQGGSQSTITVMARMISGSQWGRVWVVPSFVYIEYNILSLSNITNYALFRS